MKQNHGYEINYIENTIVVTKSFLKKAGTIGSKEYNELAKVRRDFPDFRIQQREITKKQGKKTYGNHGFKFQLQCALSKSTSHSKDLTPRIIFGRINMESEEVRSLPASS
jgi:hypothetical protein